MSDCVIISGTLEAKLRNKLFAYFHQRYVELVYVENKDDNNTTSGHYKLRLYKNKNKLQSSLYSFEINPKSMTCYINYLNSNKHQFTFVCSSQQTSICFSAHTKYERDAWLSVLEQLQWQHQPNIHHKSTDHDHDHQQEISQSNTTISRSHDTDTDNTDNTIQTESDDELYTNYAQYYDDNNNKKNVSYIISLTLQNTSNDNNYYYNYYSSNLYVPENKYSNQCGCNACRGQKFTILGLLNDEYKNSTNHINQLQSLQSPAYKHTQCQSVSNIPAIQSC